MTLIRRPRMYLAGPGAGGSAGGGRRATPQGANILTTNNPSFRCVSFSRKHHAGGIERQYFFFDNEAGQYVSPARLCPQDEVALLRPGDCLEVVPVGVQRDIYEVACLPSFLGIAEQLLDAIIEARTFTISEIQRTGFSDPSFLFRETGLKFFVGQESYKIEAKEQIERDYFPSGVLAVKGARIMDRLRGKEIIFTPQGLDLESATPFDLIIAMARLPLLAELVE